MLFAAAALVVAARAAHELRAGIAAWSLAMLVAGSAATFLVWPLVVPSRGGSMPHTLGPCFLIAGMFLLPTGPLVAAVAFAVALSGVVAGARFHRLVFEVSLAVLAYGGTSLWLDLAPRPTDAAIPYASFAVTEAAIAAALLVAQLIVRSLLLRIERGNATPHWGAFREHAIIEGLYCNALAVTFSVLARLHPALVGLVYIEIGIVWWVVSRFRRRFRELSAGAERSEETGSRAA
jgi:hypothetical protein